MCHGTCTYKLFLVVQSVIFCKIKLDMVCRNAFVFTFTQYVCIDVVLLTWRIRYVTRCLATISAKLTEIGAVIYEAVAHFVVFFHEIILLSSNSQFLVTCLLACLIVTSTSSRLPQRTLSPASHAKSFVNISCFRLYLCLWITWPLSIELASSIP